MKPVIIDVRESDEFDSQHIKDSIHLPLSTFTRQAPAFLKTLEGRNLIIMCASGKRAKLAATEAASFASSCAIEVFSGGIAEWIRQGQPVIKLRKAALPIMRQVQLTAGALVLLGVLLSRFLSPNFIYFSGFVGAGLVFAGVSGFCGMAVLLKKMPWNLDRHSSQNCNS